MATEFESSLRFFFFPSFFLLVLFLSLLPSSSMSCAICDEDYKGNGLSLSSSRAAGMERREEFLQAVSICQVFFSSFSSFLALSSPSLS